MRHHEHVPRVRTFREQTLQQRHIRTRRVEVHHDVGVGPLPECERRLRNGAFQFRRHNGRHHLVVSLERARSADVVVAHHRDERQFVVGALRKTEHVREHLLVDGRVRAVPLHEVAQLERERGVGLHARAGRLQQARHAIGPHVGVAHVFLQVELVARLRRVLHVFRMVFLRIGRIEVRIAQKRHGVCAGIFLRVQDPAAREPAGPGRASHKAQEITS